ncbi:MAG: PIN domain-containing protein [Pseudomonadota bacterium]|nr:PIN domain-containing protein [Pseudomonadota bacterium]
MKVLIDACVLYPTVMREMVIGVAKAGLIDPKWSPRILEEWARAAAKLGPGQEALARAEIAALEADWPRASFRPKDGDMSRLSLPDPNDVHVLASAIASSADVLMTMNIKDFPRQMLGHEGLVLASPDPFLLGLYEEAPAPVETVARGVLAEAIRLSGEDWTIRKLMKKARLPRLGKALEASGRL